MTDYRARAENKYLKKKAIGMKNVKEFYIENACANCGKAATLALAYFCKCGWEQIGNNHEAWLKEIKALRAENEKLHLEASKGFYTPEREGERMFYKALCEEMAKVLDKSHIYSIDEMHYKTKCRACLLLGKYNSIKTPDDFWIPGLNKLWSECTEEEREEFRNYWATKPGQESGK